MDKYKWINGYIHYIVCYVATYPLSTLKLKGYNVEVWEWLNNSIPHFLGHVIIYLY